jgi:NADPH2:quinone reductase
MASTDQPGPLKSLAVVLTRHGGPEMLEVRPWEVPPPGPHEVRVRVEAAGISFADLLICQGLHPERRRAPHVPGWDVVGVVESVGSEIAGVGVGQRVGGLAIVGGWAEHAVVPGAWVVPVPPTLAATTAVCVVFDYVVAYQMLTRSVAARRGDTVLLQGAGGGVGTAFLQVARHLGVRTLGTDRAAKRAHIEAQGGSLIDFEHEDVAQRCRELTEGRGVDYAFDGIGASVPASLRALRPGGHLVWFGMITLLSRGARDWRSSAKTAANVALAFAENLRPGGKRTSFYSIQMLARRHPDWYREDLATLMAMLVEHEIAPHIAAVRSLDEVPAALRSLAGHGPPGKQVIAIAPPASNRESALRHPAAVVSSTG